MNQTSPHAEYFSILLYETAADFIDSVLKHPQLASSKKIKTLRDALQVLSDQDGDLNFEEVRAPVAGILAAGGLLLWRVDLDSDDEDYYGISTESEREAFETFWANTEDDEHPAFEMGGAAVEPVEADSQFYDTFISEQKTAKKPKPAKTSLIAESENLYKAYGDAHPFYGYLSQEELAQGFIVSQPTYPKHNPWARAIFFDVFPTEYRDFPSPMPDLPHDQVLFLSWLTDEQILFCRRQDEPKDGYSYRYYVYDPAEVDSIASDSESTDTSSESQRQARAPLKSLSEFCPQPYDTSSGHWFLLPDGLVQRYVTRNKDETEYQHFLQVIRAQEVNTFKIDFQHEDIFLKLDQDRLLVYQFSNHKMLYSVVDTSQKSYGENPIETGMEIIPIPDFLTFAGPGSIAYLGNDEIAIAFCIENAYCIEDKNAHIHFLGRFHLVHKTLALAPLPNFHTYSKTWGCFPATRIDITRGHDDWWVLNYISNRAGKQPTCAFWNQKTNEFFDIRSNEIPEFTEPKIYYNPHLKKYMVSRNYIIALLIPFEELIKKLKVLTLSLE